jgi:type II secretory pathway component PulK
MTMTMTIDKNPTHQQRQASLSLSLSDALFSLPAGHCFSLRSMPKSRRQEPEEQLAFLMSMLEQAIEIANDVDDSFSDDSFSDNTDDEEEEKIRNQNQNQ